MQDSQGRIQDFYDGVSISNYKKLQEYNYCNYVALISWWQYKYYWPCAEIEEGTYIAIMLMCIGY